MIYKNVVLKDSRELISVAEFGHGTICMINALSEDYYEGILELSSQDKQPIGHVEKHNNPIPEMVLTFANTESLDSVILQLQELKGFMIAKKIVK